MSGWDEGAVFYSEQAQFPGGGGGGDGSRHSVLIKLKEFIRSFSSGPNVLPYRESLINDPKFLLVHFDHLDAFDPDVSDLLRYSPADYLPLFETAAAQVLAGLKSKVTGETGETEEPPPSEVQILLTSKEDPISMRTLGAPYISKLVKIGGITIAASRKKPKPLM